MNTEFFYDLMYWACLIGLVVSVSILTLEWFCGKLLDAIWPPCHEEVCRRQAVALIKKANRTLFKNRVRRSFRVLRFWNV